MKRNKRIVASIFFAFLLISFAGYSKEKKPKTVKYAVIQKKSHLSFAADYYEMVTIPGRFEKYKGGLVFTNGKLTAMHGNIDVKSINTFNRKRDQSLFAESLLDLASFPNITFQSTSIEQKEDNLLVRGKLSLKQETREITLKGKISRIIENEDQTKSVGLKLKGEIIRQNFSLTHQKQNSEGAKEVSDEIKIVLHLFAKSDGSENKVSTTKAFP